MRRVVAYVSIVVAVLAVATRSADASTTTSVYTNGSGIGEQAGTGNGSRGPRGGTSQKCIDVPLTVAPDGTVNLELPLGGGVEGTIHTPPGRMEGTWYAKWCDIADFAGVFFVPAVDPVALAAEARKYLPLPLPRPSLSPAGDQIVNLPSWLWLDGPWAPLSKTVSVPGVSVTVRAVPEQTVWTMGDGAQVVCDGPGSPYRKTSSADAQLPSCAYTYTQSSAAQPDLQYHAAVTVLWHATWTASGAVGGGDLGTIERTTNFAVRVGEVQALNTNAS
jgi:hypothetical protein